MIYIILFFLSVLNAEQSTNAVYQEFHKGIIAGPVWQQFVQKEIDQEWSKVTELDTSLSCDEVRRIEQYRKLLYKVRKISPCFGLSDDGKIKDTEEFRTQWRNLVENVSS